MSANFSVKSWQPLPSFQLDSYASGGSGKAAAIAQNVPLLADTVEVAVEAVDHDNMHSEHVLPWLEAAGRDVPLKDEHESVSHGRAVKPSKGARILPILINDIPCTGLGHSPPLGAYPEALWR